MHQVNKEKIEELNYSQLIDYLIDLKTFTLPPEPMRPEKQKAYTTDEWNYYVKSSNSYNQLVQLRKEGAERNEAEIKLVNEKLLSLIPVAHTWFLTDDKKYAFAKQCSDWPGDFPKFKYVAHPVIEDLPELKMEIVNSN